MIRLKLFASTRNGRFSLSDKNVRSNQSQPCLVHLKRFYVFVQILLIVYCSKLEKVNGDSSSVSINTKLLQNLDFGSDPCADFYQFTCGNWPVHNPRPKSKDEWNVNEIASISISKSIKNYFERFPENSTLPKIVQQSYIMYESCKDFGSAKQKGKTQNQIENYLRQFSLPNCTSLRDEYIQFRNEIYVTDKIAKWSKSVIEPILFQLLFPSWPSERDDYIGFKNDFDFIDAIAKLQRVLGVDVIFQFSVGTDAQNKTTFMLSSMGNQLMYEPIDVVRDRIKRCIHFLNPNANETDVSHLTNDIIRMEQTFTQIEKDSFKKAHNYTDINAQLDSHVRHYFYIVSEEIYRHPNSLQYSITMADQFYLEEILRMRKSDLALFVWWKFVYELIGSIEFHKTGDEFSLSCASYMVDLMGMHLGFAIMQPDFQNTTKPEILEMVDSIRSIASNEVNESSWIDNSTKQVILEKIQGITPRIGFPEHFLDDKLYEGDGELNFSPDSFLENSIKMRMWTFKRKLHSIRTAEKVDWSMPPTAVNAQYDLMENSITIPLANYHIPLFEIGMDVLDYGILGFTLGHEIAHSITGTGIYFDKNGDQIEFSDTFYEEYGNRKQCFVDQYNNFTVPGTDLRTNGETTLEENLADGVGLRLAFQSYRNHVTKYGEEEILPELKNFTHDQLFFIAYGQQWCGSFSKDGAKHFEYSEHSPYMQRVNNTVANSEDFKMAFQCNKKSRLSPNKSCPFF